MLTSNGKGAELIGNGLFMYSGGTFPADDGLAVLDIANGIMVEHVAVFECLKGDGLNIPKVEQLFDRIQEATATGKTVVMNVWPGLLT